MPSRVARSVTAAGTDEPPRPAKGMRARCSSVKSGWSRRLVRKKVAPPPTPMSSASIRRRTSPGSHTSTRFTGWSRSSGTTKALSIPMKWPTGAPVMVGGPPRGNMWSSWRASHVIVRCEWITPFGSLVVPEVNAISAGASGSTGVGAAIGSPSSRSANGGARGRGATPAGVSPTTQPARPGPIGEEALPHRQVVGEPEAVGGDDDGGVGGVEDVVDLLGAVEVHDRDDHRAEVGGRPERDAGLDPVGELEHDHVAGPDAVGGQAAGEATGRPGRRRRSCRTTAAPSTARGTRSRRARPRPSADHRARGCRRPTTPRPGTAAPGRSRRAGASTQPSIPLSRAERSNRR